MQVTEPRSPPAGARPGWPCRCFWPSWSPMPRKWRPGWPRRDHRVLVGDQG